MVAASVSVSFYEHCLVDSVGCVLLVSSTLLAPTILLFPSSLGFPVLHLMFGYGSLPLLLSTMGGSTSDDDWAKHQSMSIAEYH